MYVKRTCIVNLHIASKMWWLHDIGGVILFQEDYIHRLYQLTVISYTNFRVVVQLDWGDRKSTCHWGLWIWLTVVLRTLHKLPNELLHTSPYGSHTITGYGNNASCEYGVIHSVINSVPGFILWLIWKYLSFFIIIFDKWMVEVFKLRETLFS